MTGSASMSPHHIINPSHKTVMERCEKMSPSDKQFLPKVDRDGKLFGDSDYSIPSPPERDISHLDHYSKYNETRLSQLSIDGGYDGSQTSLTRAELEQYTRAYEDVRPPSHSQQPSYAQSEGYHSYVSSADSTTTTPFLDRLRRDNIIETSVSNNNSSNSGNGGGGGRESSASSGSSSETLKWHGSLSDVSSSGGQSSSGSAHTTQHIAHSARVPMPQRHHSESVLYLDPSAQHQNHINSQMRRLFPVTTYEPTSPRQLIESYSPSSSSRSQPKLSVAERVCEIERQSSQTRHALPSEHSSSGESKRSNSRVPDHATLKAMQKKALLSFYERHHSAWKSEPQLTAPAPSVPPPQPPPRSQPPVPVPASRRSSSASDYASSVKREMPRSHLDLSKVESNGIRESKHQHSSSCGSLSSAALGPMIIGPAISIDDWVPARPPKKPHLRGAAYQPPPRALSPDLPPPSPPPVTEEELVYTDEPLPPPPPPEEILHPNHSSHSRQDKTRFERAMNASMSLDNLTRSDVKPAALHIHKPAEPPRLFDSYYENGSEPKRINSGDHSLKNGFIEKFNERYVENRIEALQSSYGDSLSEMWEKKSAYLEIHHRYVPEKPLPSEPLPHRHSALPPPLRSKAKYQHIPDQPRSLDSNLSIVESNNEVNKPGPQTPISKKYSQSKDASYKSLRENFTRATSVPNDLLIKNSSERQSLRFTTAAHKLVVNGKIATAIQNGKISPTSRKANLVRTPSDVTRRVSYSHGIHQPEHRVSSVTPNHVEAIKQLCTELPSKPLPDPLKTSVDEVPSKQSGEHSPSFKSSPALLPHCPPTTLQLSQSKASYLSYRREPKEKEKGLPNFQGSYKRTMSPNGARIADSSAFLGQTEKSGDIGLTKSPISPIDKSISCSKLDEGDKALPSQEPDNISREHVIHSNNKTEKLNCDNREALSKTLPRNYGFPTVAATGSTTSTTSTTTTTTSIASSKRAARAPRAQSDPTSSAKVEKKSVAVSASTQDNLDEELSGEEGGGKTILVGRSQSERAASGTSDGERRCLSTSDAASQTTPTPPQSPPPVLPRRPLQEEIECDQLSRDLASQLSPSHKLHGILVPGPEVKKTTDYVSGLFRMDITPRSRNSISALPITVENSSAIGELDFQSTSSSVYQSTCTSNSRLSSIAVPPSSSPVPSMSTLQQKKQELMMRLSKKLSVLRSESVAVDEEIAVNEALGLTVTERVEKVARPQEVAKFRLHVKEVGHITSLLLSLSGRLARAENALLTLASNHQDRKTYEEKRDKLLCQLNEAKQLKANIDQRSNMVSSMLYNYLTGEEYTDYDHFINMKSKLLVDSREIAEKIQLGEEQLSALRETLDQVR